MCVVLTFDESVIGSLLLRLFLVVAGLREFDDEARQSLDDESLLLVVELFPQARLRNRNVEEVQIQLRHGSPDLDQMLQSRRQSSAAGEYLRGLEGEVSLRTNQRVANRVEDQSWFGNPSKPLESAICSHRARSAQTTVGLGDWHAPEPPVTDLQTRDVDELS